MPNPRPQTRDPHLLALFGLTTVGSLTSKNFLKGFICTALGVIISLIGIDPIMGTPRFTFGSTRLQAGISLIAALIGLFGFSEILVQIGQRSLDPISGKQGKEKVGFRQLLRHIFLSLQSAVIGTFIGALPGTGGPVASLIAYDQSKKTVRKPEVPFGEGAVEGIVASESANNACIGGALIPMLTLAVPGDAVTAVLLSAMYVHGLRPGPLLFTQTPDLFYVILAAGIISSLSIIALGISVAPLMARMVLIPKKILLPVAAILYNWRLCNKLKCIRRPDYGHLWPDWLRYEKEGILGGANGSRYCAGIVDGRQFQKSGIAGFGRRQSDNLNVLQTYQPHTDSLHTNIAVFKFRVCQDRSEEALLQRV